MNLQPIDFQGIICLDSKIIGPFEQFLQEKKEALARFIFNFIPSNLIEVQVDSMQGSQQKSQKESQEPQGTIKLSAAVE